MEKVYKSFTQLQHKGISFIYKEGKQYPKNLLQLYDMPYGLYSKGQPLCADEPAVAWWGQEDVPAMEGRLRTASQRHLHNLALLW